ncbi:hypothetical protein C2E23DRAFT_871835 [Lenzites betulinus]|nr:hypothetical protein C2E23DRAFT_871835 [Lenzites betulinus]
MDHNAWCPAGPGKHGYMQVGLGRDRKLFNEGGDYRHVFVGAGKHFLYCGWYHVQRVDPLTKEEWATLPLKVQQTYSETTVNKEKSGLLRSGKQVLGMYNSGELRAPCVRLRCVGFDTAFYQELVRANDQFFENKPRPMPPPAAGGPGPSKRRRITTMVDAGKGDESEDEPRKSVSGSAPLPALPTPPATQTPSGSVAPLSDAAKVSADDRSPSIPLASVVTTSSAALPARSTRSQSRRQTVSLKLRIPGGKSTDPTPQLEGDDFGDSDSSAGSEDDDMYAD